MCTQKALQSQMYRDAPSEVSARSCAVSALSLRSQISTNFCYVRRNVRGVTVYFCGVLPINLTKNGLRHTTRFHLHLTDCFRQNLPNWEHKAAMSFSVQYQAHCVMFRFGVLQ